jgi:hypothetical protein
MFWYGMTVSAILVLWLTFSLLDETIQPKHKFIASLVYLYMVGFTASAAFLLK